MGQIDLQISKSYKMFDIASSTPYIYTVAVVNFYEPSKQNDISLKTTKSDLMLILVSF